MITDFEFAGSTALNEGLYISDDISIPTPEERVTEYTIPGRDGTLTYKEGTYEDISITVELMYIERPDDVRERFRDIKRWLLGGGDSLKFSHQPDTHYKVKRVSIDENTRESLIKGDFSVTFLCEPFQYFDEGDTAVPLSTTIYNDGELSHPKYEITGEGVCKLTVNGNTATINVSGTVTVDTEKMITYRTLSSLTNTAMSGDYSDLFLQKGENTLSATSGFDVQITPRWRSL